jgi:ceramide glucosyltransferase
VIFAFVILALLAASCVYCVLVVIAADSFNPESPPPPAQTVSISVLKPLCGWDDELEENLASFFEQDFQDFEILLAVHQLDDAAVAVVEKLRSRYPLVAAQLVVTGEPPIPNRKVYSLHRMYELARHPVIVTSDSDVRVGPRFLSTIAAEMQHEQVGLVTCLYRADPGRYRWSVLEAVGLNTDFTGGVLVAVLIDGVKFALGPALAIRREALDRLGGFLGFKDFLAEDFMLGRLVSATGWKTFLSSYLVEHRIGAPGFLRSLKHQLRWARSTRRSRPLGYCGQLLTNPLPLALVVCILRPEWWMVIMIAGVFRTASAWATSQLVLDDPLVRRRWWLVPVQDLISFAVWIAGFFGHTVVWRGRRFRLLPDGRFRPV